MPKVLTFTGILSVYGFCVMYIGGLCAVCIGGYLMSIYFKFYRLYMDYG